MAKIVFEDDGIFKVARGNYTEDDIFITVTNEDGEKIRINKRVIVSIKEE